MGPTNEHPPGPTSYRSWGPKMTKTCSRAPVGPPRLGPLGPGLCGLGGRPNPALFLTAKISHSADPRPFSLSLYCLHRSLWARHGRSAGRTPEEHRGKQNPRKNCDPTRKSIPCTSYKALRAFLRLHQTGRFKTNRIISYLLMWTASPSPP